MGSNARAGSIPARATTNSFTTMEKEKLISISERDWHYRLIKFVWNIDPKMFKNLCPYFWLTIASLLCVPFVLLWVGIKTFFLALGSGIAWLANLIYDKFLYGLYLDSLTDAELYYMAHMNDSTTRKGNDFLKFTTLKTRDASTLERALKRRKITFEALDKFKEAFDKEVDKLIKLKEERARNIERKREIKVKAELSKKERDKKIKERMYKIVEYTKVFFLGLFLLAIVAAGVVFTTTLTQVLCWVTTITISWTAVLEALKITALIILGIAAVIGITLFGLYLRSEYDDDNLVGWKLWISYPVILLYKLMHLIFVRFFYNILIQTVLFGILGGFVEGFGEFGGIFADYFNASYSDYCPGINWEEKEK